MDYLVLLRIIAKEFHNNKNNNFCCFVGFRRVFDTIPRTKIWNRLEEIMVPLELRVVVTRLYENDIAKLKTIKGQLEEIKCNIGVKQGCPLFLTLFRRY